MRARRAARSAARNFSSCFSLVRLRQAEHALGDVAKDELAAHWRDAPDEGFAQITLDVVFGGVAVAAVRHHRLLAGVEAGFAGEIFRGVRFGAAGLACVVKGG